MKLTLSPQGNSDGIETTASVAGDVLTVDGVEYDLSPMAEGDRAEVEGAGHPFIGTITRTNGEIVAKILWRYDLTTAENNQPRTPPVFSITDGAVPDPVVRKPAPTEAAE